jgi:hypothetical protein
MTVLFYRNHFINVYGHFDEVAGFWSPVVSITGPDHDSQFLNDSHRLFETKAGAEIFGLEKANKWIDEYLTSLVGD